MSNTLTYVVGICVVNISEYDETEMLRFIIFEDGTVFEFSGYFGSLRNHIFIDKNIAAEIMKLGTYTYNYNKKIKEDIIYSNLKKGLISEYANHIDCIDKCYLINPNSTNLFIKRIMNHEMIYCEPDSVDLFNVYKRYFNV